MNEGRMNVTMLGTRGSVPVHGERFAEFGCATTCIRIRTESQEIYIDLGSGIVGASTDPDRNITVLLTHPHLDHLTGLPFFKCLYQQDRRIDVYLKPRNGLGLHQILRYLYTPPLWPIGVFDYPADMHVNGMPEVFTLGGIKVSEMEGSHPGGASVFRLNYQGASVVIATDYEHNINKDRQLIEFCEGCELLIYDGQYSEEEYITHRGYGHSTAENGIRIARECGAERLWITHHAPDHDDDALRSMESRARQLWDGVTFAREGMEIAL